MEKPTERPMEKCSLCGLEYRKLYDGLCTTCLTNTASQRIEENGENGTVCIDLEKVKFQQFNVFDAMCGRGIREP